jgi:hypothetical protein
VYQYTTLSLLDVSNILAAAEEEAPSLRRPPFALP